MQTLIFFTALTFSNLIAAQTNPPRISPPSANPANPAESCLSDICGPPAQSNLYMTQYEDRINEFVRLGTDPSQIDYPPAILEQFNKIRAANKTQIDTAIALVKKSKNLGTEKLEGFSKAFYNIVDAKS